MKILHTSDWHIGHRLYEKPREAEHIAFFNWLSNYIADNEIELLIVAGDIFDTSMPSNSSLKLYYNFLISLNETKCKRVIITAGNHDSPSTIEAPKDILNALNIYVVGRVENNIFPIEDSNIIVAAVPFLRDRDIREAISREDFNDINSRYRKALIDYYSKVAKRCAELRDDNSFCIATGHLFATNTTLSDSESSIYVGGIGDISADDFPDSFDYIALGHLHKAQKVGGKEHIRYSGSPIPLSFNDAKRDSKVILLDVNGRELNIEEVVVPKFRDLISIRCSIDEVENRLKSIDSQLPLQSWVEINIKDRDLLINEKIMDMSENLNLEVIKVSVESREFNYHSEVANRTISLSSLTPEDIFLKKCQEENFNLEDNPEVKDAFYEILSIVREDSHEN